MPAVPIDANADGGQKAAQVNRQLARRFYAPIIPIVAGLRRQGLSLRAIARELNSRGIRTRQAGKSIFSGIQIINGRLRVRFRTLEWNASQVRRVLLRAEKESKLAA